MTAIGDEQPFHDHLAGRALAILSGKGGSGKTMIATAVATIASKSRKIQEVVLVDTDFGTAGLSYYLGLHHVRNIRRGLTEILFSGITEQKEILASLQVVEGLDDESTGTICKLLPVGDFRRMLYGNSRLNPERNLPREDFLHRLSFTIAELRDPSRLIIVDCRGGVDDELAAVCDTIDDILLVAEADTTSFQATRHVADSLADMDFGHKIRGFILNKVLEDPATMQRSAGSAFGAQFLAAVPFDLEATRAFLVGELPSPDSVFVTHVQEALSKAYPEDIRPPRGRIWKATDFANLSLRSPGESLAGYAFALVIFLLGVTTSIQIAIGNPSLMTTIGLIGGVALLGVLASIETVRKVIGSWFDQILPTGRVRNRRY